MPSFRGIAISLKSQYDAATIPECACPDASSYSNSRVSSVHYGLSNNKSALTRSRTVDIAIPTFPCSQFWLSYTCLVPVNTFEVDDVRFYYFKLYANDRCLLSWGVGEAQQWRGKIVYALSSAGTDFEGRRVIEKKGLFFSKSEDPHADDSCNGGFEVRVFRAKGRKREAVKWDGSRELGNVRPGICLTTMGRVKKGEPQRMYTYALIDPKDEPYVTFKYTFMTRDELHRLELAAAKASHSERSRASAESEHPESASELPASPPPSKVAQRTLPVQNAHPTRRHAARLSLPPIRTPLAPSTTHNEPSSPIKKVVLFNAALAETANETRKFEQSKSERRDWIVTTPSPMQATLFDRPPTPLSPPCAERRESGSGGLLRKMLASALARKGSEEK